jgi:hypothetical protein
VRLALALALALVAGCAAPAPVDPYARAPDGTDAHAVTIPREQVFSSPPFGAQGHAAHVRVTWNATARVDAWIAAGAQCSAYGTHGFAPLASLLNSTGGAMDADLPTNESGCFLVDNADFAMGQAPAGPDVDMGYAVSLWIVK